MGSHKGSHVGLGFLVTLYHWLCSSFMLLGGLWVSAWLMCFVGSHMGIHVGFEFL